MLTGIMMIACTSEDDAKGGDEQFGSIYGIVTELGTAEPMKAVGVELYKSPYYAMLLKTVTFDDGHFEFKDLEPGGYQVKVVTDKYEQTNIGYVTVEAGRQARIDLQVKIRNTGLVVRSVDAIIYGANVTLKGEYSRIDYSDEASEVGFVYDTQSNPQNGGTIVKCKTSDISLIGESYSDYSFYAVVNDLTKGTYYFQAYATNYKGTTYGEIRSFVVTLPPIVMTLDPTNISGNSVTLNGRIVAEGNPAYTERGFVYSKSYNRPTVDDPDDATIKLPVSGRSKDFSANVSSLTEGVQYYVRAYAMNENEIVYGEIIPFIPSNPNYVIIDRLMVQKIDLGSGTWDIAKEMCTNSRVSGYSDWRMPTIAELSILYARREEIGGFVERGRYWSSTQSGSECYYLEFSDGTQASCPLDYKRYVRAVRTIK